MATTPTVIADDIRHNLDYLRQAAKLANDAQAVELLVGAIQGLSACAVHVEYLADVDDENVVHEADPDLEALIDAEEQAAERPLAHWSAYHLDALQRMSDMIREGTRLSHIVTTSRPDEISGHDTVYETVWSASGGPPDLVVTLRPNVRFDARWRVEGADQNGQPFLNYATTRVKVMSLVRAAFNKYATDHDANDSDANDSESAELTREDVARTVADTAELDDWRAQAVEEFGTTYGMFSYEGARAVHTEVVKAHQGWDLGDFRNADIQKLTEHVQAQVQYHRPVEVGEVYDTAVRWLIYNALARRAEVNYER